MAECYSKLPARGWWLLLQQRAWTKNEYPTDTVTDSSKKNIPAKGTLLAEIFLKREENGGVYPISVSNNEWVLNKVSFPRIKNEQMFTPGDGNTILNVMIISG